MVPEPRNREALSREEVTSERDVSDRFPAIAGGKELEPGDSFYKEEVQLAVRNGGMPLEGLRYPITPTGRHYRLVHFDIPAVDAVDWRLKVGGLVSKPMSLTLDEIKARPAVTAAVTMECAGNGRALLSPRPISQPWLLEAVGTAEWRGTPLRGLLEEAGVSEEAIEIDIAGAPSRGSQMATVTIVEFSDFECPFCGRFFPTLKQIKDTYGDRIQIVYRQFPLPNLHPSAFKAAEASLCANEQGEFWAFHDLLFQEQSRLAVRDLKEKAGRLGLNQRKFDNCLDTGRYVQQVQDDMAAGRTAGVTGTPALFVNGIPIKGGAVDFEVVAEVLDQELQRAEL